MTECKYLILGAGPSGLTVANCLKELGITSFIVLEKEAEAGGLCRSKEVDGSPLDIGGGHFLDVRRTKVLEFLFNFMPRDEWNYYERDSRIAIRDQVINHPIESNIWQLDIDDQTRYLKSIAEAGCNNNKPVPELFVDWIYWKLGHAIADDYMIPYNKKMFGRYLNELGTYWLDKLPSVNYEETLMSCLNKCAYGKQPGHAQFYYPKRYGYGEIWLRMANSVSNNIEYNQEVTSIDYAGRVVTTKNGDKYRAEKIITSIPWKSIRNHIGMPEIVKEAVDSLKHTSIQINYFADSMKTSAQWIYYPDPQLTYHRILFRENFCKHSRGYWTESNVERIRNKEQKGICFLNEYAYPVNTLDKPKNISFIHNWAENMGVIGVGRWGEHMHYNSDLVVERAMLLSKRLMEK